MPSELGTKRYQNGRMLRMARERLEILQRRIADLEKQQERLALDMVRERRERRLERMQSKRSAKQ